MEEAVGKLWHRWITRITQKNYPDAAVDLKHAQKKLALYFHAFGGDPMLTLKAASREQWHAHQPWISRIAGRQWQAQLCWCDNEHLYMPGSLSLFPEYELNELTYFWLAALAAHNKNMPYTDDSWLHRNQLQIVSTLQQWPGLRPVYQRLARAHLLQRQQPHSELKKWQETQLRKAILNPGSINIHRIDPRALEPIPIWLHPFPPTTQEPTAQPTADIDSESSQAKEVESDHSRQGKKSDHSKDDEGLLAFRLESLFSWAEFVNVDRPQEDDEDLGAEKAANDLDDFVVSSRSGSVKKKLKFDLDLPANQYEDIILKEGVLLPEWDFKKGILIDDVCRLNLMVSRESSPCPLPAHLRKPSQRIRAFFEQISLNRQWLRMQPQGSEIDWDAYLDAVTRCKLGQKESAQGLFKEVRRHHRDLSCLLLADLSLSTEAAVDNHNKVIDVIRDGLFLMSEAMQATGDRFGIAGFSSKNRDRIRYYPIKTFDEPLTPIIRGRIQAINPGFYTRMGAAIRYASKALGQEKTSHRLLLLLSDGKPNDVDRYEGRYGIEDTRMAVQEAVKSGLVPFCITIDQQGNEYLPYIFGQKNYVVIRNAKQLPIQLPQIYARLTEHL